MVAFSYSRLSVQFAYGFKVQLATSAAVGRAIHMPSALVLYRAEWQILGRNGLKFTAGHV
jgi:hypothetical protein